ncbi:intraflagellar transport protein 25 homolog [Anneissia japonica]|uniref:intraflagellar transport protein 25 homolog n=1 Tax=Anneissia japonica TaxID=1529436 RepID=UPI0014259F00|nr:intraflagellar transport protein 25 homolog [Anneissia japonica]
MFDVALMDAGAQVVLATSSDENHPPENMLDGSLETFYTTTGMFPQEFIISFQSLMNINKIKLHSYQVNEVSVSRSVQNDKTDFETLADKAFTKTEGSLQNEEFSFEATTAHHLKFVIKSGHDLFTSIYRVHVDGSAIHQ